MTDQDMWFDIIRAALIGLAASFVMFSIIMWIVRF